MMATVDLVLASASPRRHALLAQMGLTFRVVVSGLEEAPWPGEKPASYALRNALDKARAVMEKSEIKNSKSQNLLVVSADTIVVLGDAILEKPQDEAHARAMLRQLSGRWHEVMTGVAIIKSDLQILKSEIGLEAGFVGITRVRFRDLTDQEIADYVAGGEPMDKAGAYAIQGGAAGMVAEIEGSHSNVVGLPVEQLAEFFQSLEKRSWAQMKKGGCHACG